MPAVLCAVGIHSLWNGEAKELWTWSEEVGEGEEAAGEDVKADAKQEVAEEARKSR